MKLKNLVLIPIILAILAATAWAVYKTSEKAAPEPAAAAQPQRAQPENFFESTYRERLKEEGNRTAVTEKMIKDGKLSSEPARHLKIAGEAKP